jgi:hypothetical protein
MRSENRGIFKKLHRFLVLNELTTIMIIALLILTIVLVVNQSQRNVEAEANDFISKLTDSPTTKRYELAKLKAEVDQIRSDTSGSLFWLKLIGLFVTVGGAVGGYLVAQSKATKERLSFEHRKDVDQAYQAIVQELSKKDEPLLRAAAAVKLGSIMNEFPAEWKVNDERKKQLVQLTKQVLAAALTIETEEKIRKTITIAIAQDKSIPRELKGKNTNFADVREIDFSGANAKNAYWAKADFSYADFFRADLSNVSFRSSILKSVQFKEAKLTNAVLVESDLTNAVLEEADCEGANFAGAKVLGMKLKGAILEGVDKKVEVDVSEKGDGSKMVMFEEWLANNVS